MTIIPISLLSLKRIKNSIIGNPSAKLALAKDELFVTRLVGCLNHSSVVEGDAQGSQDDIRIEAAHIIASLAYGSQDALRILLRAEATRSFLTAVANFQPTDSTVLRSSFARGLRVVSAAIAELVGPSQWGLRPVASDIRMEAKAALDDLFQIGYLDIYLPLLVDSSTQTSTSIALLLGTAVRNSRHRAAVTEWLPPAVRIKESKGKRGWEKPATINLNAASRLGGWVAKNLTGLLRSRDIKLQEAALSALAALSHENPSLCTVLARSTPERDVSSPLSSVLSLCKSRAPDVQLAASLCAAHIIRSSTSILADSSLPLMVMHVTNRIIASQSDSPQNRTKACFILYHLVKDHQDLCDDAVEGGSLEKLAALIKTITPLETTTDWDEDEPESISCLREAAFTAIAALCLFEDDIRREVADMHGLIPMIQHSLGHRHVGVRYAACQCVRVLSRAVAVIRTSILDSGLGMSVFQLFKKEDEDKRVTAAASSAVCNLVNEFSPLRPTFLEQGLLPRIVQLVNSDNTDLRLNALWAVKNLVRKSSSDTKRDIMNHIGWHELAELLSDVDLAVQEQAWNILRNMAENDGGIDMIFREIGTQTLLAQLTTALNVSDDRIALQATCALANLINGTGAHQDLILSNAGLLAALRGSLANPLPEVRKAGVACVLELARSNPRRRTELVEAGILATLRRMCEWGIGSGSMVGALGGVAVGSGVGIVSPGERTSGVSVLMGEDREVVEHAKAALDWIESEAEIIM